jgi:DNA-binding protein H-NS
MGFLDQQRSRVDRRSVRIKLTEKGQRRLRDGARAPREARAHGRAGRRHRGGRVRRAEQGAAPLGALLDRPNSVSSLIVFSEVSRALTGATGQERAPRFTGCSSGRRQLAPVLSRPPAPSTTSVFQNLSEALYGLQEAFHQLETLSIEALAELRDAVTAKLADGVAAKQKELEVEIARINGLNSKVSAPKPKAPPKYRGPKGEEWSGRGSQPAFVRDHLAAAGTLDQLKV